MFWPPYVEEDVRLIRNRRAPARSADPCQYEVLAPSRGVPRDVEASRDQVSSVQHSTRQTTNGWRPRTRRCQRRQAEWFRHDDEDPPSIAATPRSLGSRTTSRPSRAMRNTKWTPSAARHSRQDADRTGTVRLERELWPQIQAARRLFETYGDEIAATLPARRAPRVVRDRGGRARPRCSRGSGVARPTTHWTDGSVPARTCCAANDRRGSGRRLTRSKWHRTTPGSASAVPFFHHMLRVQLRARSVGAWDRRTRTPTATEPRGSSRTRF